MVTSLEYVPPEFALNVYLPDVLFTGVISPDGLILKIFSTGILLPCESVAVHSIGEGALVCTLSERVVGNPATDTPAMFEFKSLSPEIDILMYGSVTVNVVEAYAPVLLLAVIVVVPLPMAVISPLEDMVATEGLLELHLTVA